MSSSCGPPHPCPAANGVPCTLVPGSPGCCKEAVEPVDPSDYTSGPIVYAGRQRSDAKSVRDVQRFLIGDGAVPADAEPGWTDPATQAAIDRWTTSQYAKPVDPVRASLQVVDETLARANAKTVDPDGVDDSEPDAKPVDPPEELGEFIQRALGVAITQPIEPPESIRDSIRRAAERIASMPYQAWTPPVVHPRDAARVYAEAPVVEPFGGLVNVSWEGPESIIGGLPQDQQPRHHTAMSSQGETIAQVIPVPAGGLYELNSFVIRAEVPPAPGSERAAELARAAAQRKRKARRAGARKVGRVARERARGIRPCTHDCDRSDW